MKHLIAILSVSIILTSCVTVVYENPQPEGLDELVSIPEDLWGFYDPNGRERDTIIIAEKNITFPWESDRFEATFDDLDYHLNNIRSDTSWSIIEEAFNIDTNDNGYVVDYYWRYHLKIGENCILKKHNEIFFLNFEVSPNDSGLVAYYCVPFEMKNDSLYLYWYEDQGEPVAADETWALGDQLRHITDVTVLDDETLLLNPTHMELQKLFIDGSIERSEDPLPRYE